MLKFTADAIQLLRSPGVPVLVHQTGVQTVCRAPHALPAHQYQSSFAPQRFRYNWKCHLCGSQKPFTELFVRSSAADASLVIYQDISCDSGRTGHTGNCAAWRPIPALARLAACCSGFSETPSHLHLTPSHLHLTPSRH